jgi:hypothetical protein
VRPQGQRPTAGGVTSFYRYKRAIDLALFLAVTVITPALVMVAALLFGVEP